MARKKMNTKVALLGSVVVGVLALIVVITLAYTRRDSASYLADAARAADQGAYEDALRYYVRAYELIDDREQKIEILFDMAQMYRGLDQWSKVMGCWNAVVLEDPNHVRARLALVQAMTMEARAHSKAGVSLGAAWKDLETKVEDLLDHAAQQDLLSESLSNLQEPMLNEAFTTQADTRLSQYLYQVRGQARLEQAEAGSVAEPLDTLDLAEQDLHEVIKNDPTVVQAYELLSRVYRERAVLQGAKADVVGQETSLLQAEEILKQATQAASDQAEAHVLLMDFRLGRAQQTESGREALALQQLEGSYLQLVNRFPQSAEAYDSLAQFQLIRAYFVSIHQRLSFFDKAIAAAQQALDFDPYHVERTLTLAVMHYRKATMFELADEFDQAVTIARRALTYEATQESSGPLAVQFKLNRLAIHRFLATCAVEQILDCGTDQAQPEMLNLAQKSIHEIEQIRGSGEDLEVAKWRGMLSLVNGQRAAGIRELVSVYDKMRASTQTSRADAQVSYALGRAFEHTPEQGKALEYFAMALHGGLRFTRPQVMLDYLEVLGRLDRWGFVISGANPYGIDTYERLFGANDRSRKLRLQALLSTHRMADAEQILYGLDAQAPETLALRLRLLRIRIQEGIQALSQDRPAGMMPWEANPTTHDSAQVSHISTELRGLMDQQVLYVEQLLDAQPDLVTSADFANACDHLLEQPDLQRCRTLCERFLATHEDDATGRFYQVLLQQDQPDQLTDEQRFALQEEAAQSITDPISRHMELGAYYRRMGRLDEALKECQQVLDCAIHEGLSMEGIWDTQHPVIVAADTAFEILLHQEQWSQAESLLEKIRKLNVDQCGGMLFDARLVLTRLDTQRALEKINLCLEHRPVFSHGMLLRSMIDMAMEQPEEAVADVTLAAQWNPTSVGIAKFKVTALIARNRALGGNLNQQQKNELLIALEEALRLASDDMELLELYVEQIKEDQPEKAVAIYQVVQRQHPTLQNSLALGTLATDLAGKSSDVSRRRFYLEIAGKSLGQAYNLHPAQPEVLQAYAAYYRLMGENDKAEALLQQSGKVGLRWMELLTQGHFDQAHQVLQEAYQDNPRDPSTLKGLAALSEISHDLDGLARYMDELVAVEDTVFNRSNQVGVLLKTGVTHLAQDRLAQLEQRFPQAPELALYQGWLALREGRHRDAEAGLSRFLTQHPGHAQALALRGQVYLLEERIDDAIGDLTQSSQIESRSDTRLLLAQAYGFNRDWAAAVRELETVLKMPGAPRRAVLMLEQIYRRQGNANALRQLYQMKIKQNPGDIHWLNQLADWDMQEKRFSDAARNYAMAWARRVPLFANLSPDEWPIDPDLVQACDGHFQALLANNLPDQVVSDASAYLKGPYACLVHARLAQAQERLNRHPEALESLKTALSEAALDVERLTQLLEGTGEFLQAEQIGRVVDQLVQSSSKDLEGLALQFCWMRQQGRFEEALKQIDQILQQVGQDMDQRLAWIGLKADFVSQRDEQSPDPELLRQAVREYQSLLVNMPKNSSVLNNTAYLMALGQMDLSQALVYAQTALEQVPDNPIILDTLGYVMHRLGRQEESLRFLSAAYQQFELNGMIVPADVFEHLGMTRAALGQVRQARRAYERALETGDLTLSDSAKQRIQTAIGRLP